MFIPQLELISLLFIPHSTCTFSDNVNNFVVIGNLFVSIEQDITMFLVEMSR
jgi:hypothetical protein